MKKLNLAIFKQQVELYSADLSRWPQAMIHPAIDFMQQNEAARVFFTEMEKVEDMLRYDAPARVTAQSLERLQNDIIAALKLQSPAAPSARKKKGRQRRDRAEGNFVQKWFTAYMAPAASGLIAACFLGIIVGLAPSAQAGIDADPFAVTAVNTVGEDSSAFDGSIF